MLRMNQKREGWDTSQTLTKLVYIYRLLCMKPLRMSPQTMRLLESLLHAPAEWRYGYDLSGETGLKSGTLYPILMRLAERSLLETRWEEAAAPGRPPRHMYRLTGIGLEWAAPCRTRVRVAS
jgi:DNA-binding MarR family transcriptional regulator